MSLQATNKIAEWVHRFGQVSAGGAASGQEGAWAPLAKSTWIHMSMRYYKSILCRIFVKTIFSGQVGTFL